MSVVPGTAGVHARWIPQQGGEEHVCVHMGPGVQPHLRLPACFGWMGLTSGAGKSLNG